MSPLSTKNGPRDVRLDVLDRARRAERRLLDRRSVIVIPKRAAVAEVVDDRLRHVARRKNYVANFGCVQTLERAR